MSITSSDFSRTYAGDGSALSCPFPLAFWDEAELKVVQVAADGTETVLVLDTDYTLSGGVTENGIVTYPSGCTIAYPKAGSGLSNLPVGENLFAYVEIDFTQPTDFVNYSFDKDLLEKELDRACRRDLHLKRQYDLTIRYPISTDPADVEDVATIISTMEGHQSAAEAAKTAAETAETNAETAETAAETAQAAAEAAQAALTLPSITAPDADKMLRVKSDGSGWELVAMASGAETAAGTIDDQPVTPDGLADFIGYAYIELDAGSFAPAGTNGPEAGTFEFPTNDLTRDYYAFDGAVEESIHRTVPMPPQWDRGTVKAKVKWSPGDSACTAGDTVEWEIALGAVGDDDALDRALGTAQVISDAALAGKDGDLHISGATPAITVGGSPAVGDDIDIQISRNVSGTDDMTEDAWFWKVVLEVKLTNTVTPW